MSYNPTTWHTGDIVSADKLNNVEQELITLDTASNKNFSDINQIKNNLGDLTNLTTTVKTNLVSAINEAAQSAEESATDAEQSAQSVSASVQQIATNKADISQIKADLDDKDYAIEGFKSGYKVIGKNDALYNLRVKTSVVTPVDDPDGTRIRLIFKIDSSFRFRARCTKESGIAISRYSSLGKAISASSNYIETYTNDAYTTELVQVDYEYDYRPSYISISQKIVSGGAISDAKRAELFDALELSIELPAPTEVEGLQSDLKKSYRLCDEFVYGQYAPDGGIAATNRFSTLLLKVERGQHIYVDAGSLLHGVLLWEGETLPTATMVRNENSADNQIRYEMIRIVKNGFLSIAFSKNGEKTYPSDFDGEVRIYSPQIKSVSDKVEDLTALTEDVFPTEYVYSKYINVVVGSLLSYGNSPYFNTARFPVEAGVKYKAQTVGRTTTTKYLVFVDGDNKIISYVEHTASYDGEVFNVDITAPNNAVALFVSSVATSSDVTLRGSTVQHIRLKKYLPIKTEVDRISEIVNSDSRLLKGEQLMRVEAAKRRFTNTPNLNYAENPLPTFVHVTDVHGDSERLSNAVQIANEIGADAILNTGDSVYYKSTDDLTYLVTATLESNVPMLSVVGNHDSYIVTEKEMYESIIEPFSDDYVLDTNVDYSTYFYKDFSNHGIRVIGLNQFQYRGVSNYTTQRHYHQAQIDFLCDALLSAPDDYGIIILLHTPETGTVKSQGYEKFYQNEILYNNVAGSIYPVYEIVDAYISGTTLNKTWNNYEGNTPQTFTVDVDFSAKNDSEFICYVSGHMHRDAIYYIIGVTNKQVMLNEVCTNAWTHRNTDGSSGSSYPYYCEMSDIPRVIGNETENAVNVYTIDKVRKHIRIARFGSDMPFSGAGKRDYMIIPYAD